MGFSFPPSFSHLPLPHFPKESRAFTRLQSRHRESFGSVTVSNPMKKNIAIDDSCINQSPMHLRFVSFSDFHMLLLSAKSSISHRAFWLLWQHSDLTSVLTWHSRHEENFPLSST